MKVTLIITTYNRPDALLRVLEGLMLQIRPADEIIVADDGSGEKTQETVQKYMSGSLPLLHVRHEDKGFRAARIRNLAIRESKGDYIVLLDGDCIPGRFFIKDHLDLAEKGLFFQGKRILVGQGLAGSFTHADADSAGTLLKYAFSGKISNSHHLLRLPFFPALVSKGMDGIKSCNMGFFREDIFAVNGFNQNFVGWGREDSELAIRFFKSGLNKKEHPFRAVCFHLWHEENDRDRLKINDDILRKIKESNEYTCSNGLVKKQP